MEVKIKKLNENAVIPTYAHLSDAGADLTATSKYEDENGCVVYGTGLAFEIPDGYMGLLFPRSSNAEKQLLLSDSVGVIDSGYRGEIMMKFRKCYPMEAPHYKVGERIGQIVIMPYLKITFVEADVLSKSDRCKNGFGSSGK